MTFLKPIRRKGSQTPRARRGSAIRAARRDEARKNAPSRRRGSRAQRPGKRGALPTSAPAANFREPPLCEVRARSPERHCHFHIYLSCFLQNSMSRHLAPRPGDAPVAPLASKPWSRFPSARGPLPDTGQAESWSRIKALAGHSSGQPSTALTASWSNPERRRACIAVQRRSAADTRSMWPLGAIATLECGTSLLC